MGLREKAEAEKAKQFSAEAAEREQAEKDRRDLAAKRVAGAAKYLARWSGETVTADDLELLADNSGAMKWRINLDGFDLEVTAAGGPKSSVRYEVWQRLATGDCRPVEKPALLLDPIGMR